MSVCLVALYVLALHSRLAVVGCSRIGRSSSSRLPKTDHLVTGVSSRWVITSRRWVVMSDIWRTAISDNRSTTSHAVTSDRLSTVVPGPHVLSHDIVPVLPSFRVFVKGASSGEVISLAMLLLPLGKSAHVPFGRFARWPKIGDQGKEVEDENESDGPFESGGDRGDSVALRGRVASGGFSITTARGVGSSKADGAGNSKPNDDEFEQRVSPQVFSIWVILVQGPDLTSLEDG